MARAKKIVGTKNRGVKESEVIFAPCSKPQEAFLNQENAAFFTLYGGSAGAGKSAAILGSILPLCHHPGTRAIIIRQTTRMLAGVGGLFDAAIQLFYKVDPKLRVNNKDLIITFSSGAVVQFTYLDKPQDRNSLQGKEYSFMAFDECQQLSEDNVLYALSRLRSTIVDYPVRAVATCNPDYNSFLRKWVEFCLDERGIPIRYPDHNYPLRYYVNTGNGGIRWFDNLEEATAIYGNKRDSGIKSFRFIPATAEDNKVLLRTNPEYLSTLRSLPRVEMERLLLGSWYARESASGYFKREWVEIVDTPNYNANKRVRVWDLAFSKPSEVRPDVDATCGTLVSKDNLNIYTVEDCFLMRDRVHEVERAIFSIAEKDGREVTIVLPLDPGATAGAYCRDLSRRLSERGFHVKLVKPEKGKQQRFLPFASAAEARFVRFVNGDWLEEAFTELENMDFSHHTHDDVADTLSDAFFILNKETTLPIFNVPDLAMNSPSRIPSVTSVPTSGATLPKSFV